MSNQDIDKLELLAQGINEVVDVGEDILEDGKVSFSDLQYSDELYNALKKMVESIKEYRELGSELKDLDSIEAIEILQVLLKK